MTSYIRINNDNLLFEPQTTYNHIRNTIHQKLKSIDNVTIDNNKLILSNPSHKLIILTENITPFIFHSFTKRLKEISSLKYGRNEL